MTKKFFFGKNIVMREITQDVTKTKQLIKDIKGMRIKIKVNRGRNKTEVYVGEVENTYPMIFTFRRTTGELNSFSYADILSKNIRFFKTTDLKEDI